MTTPRGVASWRVSAVTLRLRQFVADDAPLLAVMLTEIQALDMLTNRASLVSEPGSGIGIQAAPIGPLLALYRRGVALDDRVLRTAERFERADRRDQQAG